MVRRARTIQVQNQKNGWKGLWQNRTILRLNKDGSLSPKTQELGLTTRILENTIEEFPISRQKRRIEDADIEECIREHHDPPEYGHPGIARTMEAIKRSYHSKDMRKHVTGIHREV